MERACRVLITFAFILLFAGNVWASPETFTTDPGASSVTVTDTAPYGNVTGTVVLPLETFSLDDNATQTLDFFTLTTSGFALNQSYDVTATLAFSTPPLLGTGSGGGIFYTAIGILSYGTLTWSEPSPITLADGNVIQISFPDLKGYFGNTVTVEASVTNTPEPPSGLLLFSFGPIILLSNACRKWFKRA